MPGSTARWLAHAFNAEFQAMITRIRLAGDLSRPGADDRTRRLLELGGDYREPQPLGGVPLGACPRRAERAAPGFTQDDLKEILMQTAIYARRCRPRDTAFAEAAAVMRMKIEAAG